MLGLETEAGTTPGPDSTGPSQEQDELRQARPARRKLIVSSIAVAATLALGGGGAVAWQMLSPAPKPQTRVEAPNTVAASSGPLTWSIKTTGTVTFANLREFPASLGGVLTELPATGTVLSSGDVLYRVDDKPVFYFGGKLPAWRDFKAGMDDGPDVKQLEQVLADLGYFGGWVDESFTDLTTQAIKAWQKDNGMKEDGVIPRGGIVFGEGGIRVGAPKAEIGASIAPGAALFEASGAAAIVTAEIPISDRASVPVGTVATFALPSGESVTGKVTAVGDPTEKDDDRGGKKVVIPITITPDDPKKLAGQNALSVQVSFTHQAEGDVLQVPVTALLAAKNDTFTVEVYRKQKIVTVPVETGRFASGMVEITGGELAAGDLVVVPS